MNWPTSLALGLVCATVAWIVYLWKGLGCP